MGCHIIPLLKEFSSRKLRYTNKKETKRDKRNKAKIARKFEVPHHPLVERNFDPKFKAYLRIDVITKSDRVLGLHLFRTFPRELWTTT
jgi:hypothetical protein